MNSSIKALVFIVTLSFSFCIQYHCDGVAPIAGYDNFLVINDYFPFTLRFESPQKVFLNSNNYKNRPSSSIQSNQEGLRIDFGQSDQYEFFTFPKEVADDLLQGKLQEVRGFYEDGFDWSNGYNTRAKFSILCHKMIIH